MLYVQDIVQENDKVYVMKLCDGRFSMFCETSSSGKEDSKYLYFLIQKK